MQPVDSARLDNQAAACIAPLGTPTAGSQPYRHRSNSLTTNVLCNKTLRLGEGCHTHTQHTTHARTRIKLGMASQHPACRRAGARRFVVTAVTRRCTQACRARHGKERRQCHSQRVGHARCCAQHGCRRRPPPAIAHTWLLPHAKHGIASRNNGTKPRPTRTQP